MRLSFLPTGTSLSSVREIIRWAWLLKTKQKNALQSKSKNFILIAHFHNQDNRFWRLLVLIRPWVSVTLGSSKTQVPRNSAGFHFLRSTNPQTTRGLDTIPPSDDESRSLVCVWSSFLVSISVPFHACRDRLCIPARANVAFSRASLYRSNPSPFF